MAKKGWDWIPCPACKQPAPPNAKRCSVCHIDWTPQQIAERARKAKNGKIGCGLLAVIAVLGFAISNMGSSEGVSSPNSVPSSAAASEAPLPKLGSTPLQLQDGAKQFYRDVMVAMKPCDITSKAMANIADATSSGRSSVYDAYAAAKRANVGCEQSSMTISSMEVPAVLTGQVGEAATKAKELCESAALAKKSGAEMAQVIFDGDMRPSKVDEFSQRANTAQLRLFACVASLFDMGTKAGVDVSKIDKAL